MNPVHSLIASADIAETQGRHELAKFWRGMAHDAGSFPHLYDNWARQAREYVRTRLMPVMGEGE